MPHQVVFAPEAEARLVALYQYIAQQASPEVLGVLVEKFDIRPTGDAQEDLARMLQAA